MRQQQLITGLSVLIGVLALANCVTTSPTPPEPPPPPPSVVVPEGCLELQAGTWVHADDPTWRYEGDDDGGALTILVHHRVIIDAGFSPRKFRKPDGGVDAGPLAPSEDAGTLNELPTARIELQRTDAGFFGATITRFNHPSGRSCDVQFPTRVIACGDAGLVLETEESTALGDACQPPARPAEVSRRQHHLVRLGIDGG